MLVSVLAYCLQISNYFNRYYELQEFNMVGLIWEGGLAVNRQVSRRGGGKHWAHSTELLSVSETPTYLLAYSKVQSPSWEANWFAASQEIPRISRNPKVRYLTHKRPPPVSILGQPNPVHIPTSHLLKIHPNIHPSTPKSPQWSPSLRFPHQDRNSDSHWYCEFTPNGLNVCERDITLPARSEVSLAAATPCRLQLFTVPASNVVSAVLLSPPATPSWWAPLTVGSL